METLDNIQPFPSTKNKSPGETVMVRIRAWIQVLARAVIGREIKSFSIKIDQAKIERADSD